MEDPPEEFPAPRPYAPDQDMQMAVHQLIAKKEDPETGDGQGQCIHSLAETLPVRKKRDRLQMVGSQVIDTRAPLERIIKVCRPHLAPQFYIHSKTGQSKTKQKKRPCQVAGSRFFRFFRKYLCFFWIMRLFCGMIPLHVMERNSCSALPFCTTVKERAASEPQPSGKRPRQSFPARKVSVELPPVCDYFILLKAPMKPHSPDALS